MFGIIMAVISTAHALFDGCKKGCEHVSAMQRGYQRQLDGTDNTYTYFDLNGNRRDLKTREIRTLDLKVVEADGQDRCLRDLSGNVIRNFTEEERNVRKYKAIDNKRTVYLYRELGNGIYNGSVHREFGGDGYCEGSQFKDLKTGEIYVGRMFCIADEKELGEKAPLFSGVVTFYMNLQGYLVRESDSQIAKRKRGEIVPSEEMVSSFINKFNNKQKENGWNNCKDKIFHIDSFGNKGQRNEYMTKQFYCNNNSVNEDI